MTRFFPLSLFLAFLFCPIISSAQTHPTQPAPFAAQLNHECDALLHDAIQRPYGLGWTQSPESQVQINKSQKSPQVSMQPGDDPTAALLLLWAGDLLNEPRYREAAIQAARAVAMSQDEVGKFPAQAIFNVSDKGREPQTLAPDRRSTCAGLALLLSVLDQQGDKRDDELQRSAHLAAGWMRRQQTQTGMWPVAYPPDLPAKNQTRLIRLDTSDTRDCTLTMLLSYEVLGQADDRRSIERSIAAIERMRLGDASKAGSALWGDVYTLEGMLNRKIPELPPCIDLEAARYSMQAMLDAYVVLGLPEAKEGLDDAQKSLLALPRQDAQWIRCYDLNDPKFPAIKRGGLDNSYLRPPTPETFDPRMTPGDFGLTPILNAMSVIHDQGRAKYRDSFQPLLTCRQQLAAAISGLLDSPCAPDFPHNAAEADAYLKAHQRDWLLLQGPAPTDLSPRVQRLWLLLIRAKIELNFGK